MLIGTKDENGAIASINYPIMRQEKIVGYFSCCIKWASLIVFSFLSNIAMSLDTIAIFLSQIIKFFDTILPSLNEPTIAPSNIVRLLTKIVTEPSNIIM